MSPSGPSSLQGQVLYPVGHLSQSACDTPLFRAVFTVHVAGEVERRRRREGLEAGVVEPRRRRREGLEGACVGPGVGACVGASVGACVGAAVGASVSGSLSGSGVGAGVGAAVPCSVV